MGTSGKNWGRSCIWMIGAALILNPAHTAEAATETTLSLGYSPPPPTVQATRSAGPILLDGRLDDPAWTEALPWTDFRQRDPDEGQPASERTELKVSYDDRALYVAVRSFDRQPDRIVRRLSRRDAVADADRVAVYLDPYHDRTTGAVFEVSAAGAQRDAVIFNDTWTDDSWDAVWESAVSADAQGWAVELRIPFSELRFTAEEEQIWGINVCRTIHRRHEDAWLALVPKDENGLASRMARLTGLDGIERRSHLAVVPYIVQKGEFLDTEPGDPFGDGSRLPSGVGVDVKYNVTSNLVLDAAANPDFGQVEVDPAVVNLSAFETFFQEKRLFFVEGAQTFGSFGRNGPNVRFGFGWEPDLFYSRRIGRSPQGSTDADFEERPFGTTILGAAKITGKTSNGWSLGILDAVTSREWADLGDRSGRWRQEIEPLTNYFVARGYREAGRGGLGFIATAVNRDLRDPELAGELVSQAYVGGVDGHYFLDGGNGWVVTGNVSGSFLHGSAAAVEESQRASQRYFQRPDRKQVLLDPDATSLSGWSGGLNLNRNSGNLRLNAALWANSPGFESNDLGFNWRSDRFGAHVAGIWRKTEPDRLTRRRSLVLAKWYICNFDRERQDDGLSAAWDAQLRNYWTVGGGAYKTWRVQDDRLTRGGPSMTNLPMIGGGLFVETDTRKRATLRLESKYDHNELGGRLWVGAASVELKPSSRLSLSLGPEVSRGRDLAGWVASLEDPTATATYGERHVFADLRRTDVAMTFRANLALSPTISFQLYAQPLLSVADYEGFKELARPRAFDFVEYGRDGGAL